MGVLVQTLLHIIGNWFFNSLCLFACSRWISGVSLTPVEGIPDYILVLELGLILTFQSVPVAMKLHARFLRTAKRSKMTGA